MILSLMGGGEMGEPLAQKDIEYMEKMHKIFIAAILCFAFGFFIMALGAILENTPYELDPKIFVGIILVLFFVSIAMLLISFGGEMAREAAKKNAVYNARELSEIVSMEKTVVREKLLANKFKEDGGYFRKKQFSFLELKNRYYDVRIVESADLEYTIETEIQVFEKNVTDKKHILLLLIYCDRQKVLGWDSVKTIGVKNVLSEDFSIQPRRKMAVVCAVDTATNIGYFFDNGKVSRIFAYLYPPGCRMLRKVFDDPYS